MKFPCKFLNCNGEINAYIYVCVHIKLKEFFFKISVGNMWAKMFL